ncbi:hypothetical protein jhhlp_000126 [Lomentospora prolificans]|uniref:6-phosphogluconolactonase n=1 Tax=Lomentospora prolificans TaxID=41688 RepID=A0A2N3NLM7_9PEZI|nr:hypothetical protein jhhlp_000126 [Lomentospora prolificans]
MRFASFLLNAALAAAAAVPSLDIAKRQVPGTPSKLLIGVPNSVLLVDFDGITFNVVANATEEGTNPSWLAFREPNLLYAVDEFNAVTKLFVVDRDSNTLQLVQNAAGSAGVVHLEFNLDKTRMVGSSFSGTGMIDIWDITDGTLRLLKQIASNDPLGPNAARQEAPHPHQSVLDPSGRFFVVNDLGTDTLLVIDSQEDQFEVVNRVRVTPDGCGPRHGAFFPRGAQAATHYVLLCELLNVVEVFQVSYVENSIQFVPTQVISSFGQDLPPANATTATAGEIIISSDNRDVYVSNRNTGNQTDSITHFRVNVPAEEGGPISLDFSESISSGGSVPRMFSFSADESLLFSTNQNSGFGLIALARNGNNIAPQGGAVTSNADFGVAVEAAGTLVASPVAALEIGAFGAANAGPQFAMQI